MVDLFPGKPFSFGALRKTFGPLYLRCDICRRFALLQLGAHELRDVDYRTKRFSCSVCCEEAWLTVTDPRTERGMGDYRLDQRERGAFQFESGRRGRSNNHGRRRRQRRRV